MEFIGTFGSGHVPYGNCYTRIEANSRDEAHEKMMSACGASWSHIYHPKELDNEELTRWREIPFKSVMERPPCSTRCRESAMPHVKKCKNFKPLPDPASPEDALYTLTRYIHKHDLVADLGSSLSMAERAIEYYMYMLEISEAEVTSYLTPEEFLHSQVEEFGQS